MVLHTIQIIQQDQNMIICNELMATNKSGFCEHLDAGCNQGIILYLNSLTPAPHKQEISIDKWWSIYIDISITHLYSL